MNVESGKNIAEALACGFTLLTGAALFCGVVKKKWKERADIFVIVFTVLTGASLFSQWSLGREVARENKRHADEEVNRQQTILKDQKDAVAKLKSDLEKEISEGEKSREAANKELADKQAQTAKITQALADAQKQAAAAAAAAPPASTSGGGG
jgi:hypothetical protein